MMSSHFGLRSTRTSVSCALVLFMLAVLLPQSALARETEHFFEVKGALANEKAAANLGATPFHMKGAAHPEGGKKLGEVTSNWTTRGAFRSDEKSCQVAFLSAMIELQKQAQAKGGDTLIDVVSTTKGHETESPTAFRCVAGATVVHVGLKATIVQAP